MRPKIVIVILAVALVLVGLMVVFRGSLGGNRGAAAASDVEAKNDAPPSAAESSSNPSSSNSPGLSEEARSAQVQKEVDQITGLVVGGIDPSTTSMLLAKLNHPEAEVRKAAVDALVQLNDTNAIPGLESAAANVQDPHEKVALLDALAYLKLPEVTASVEGRLSPNTLDDAGRVNALNKANRNLRPQSAKRAHRAAAPLAPGQTQPVAPSQESPQAQ